MPQGPLAVAPVSNAKTQLNISAKTVIKTGPGRVLKISFVSASTAAPGVYDAATTAAGVQATALWVGAATTAVGTVVALDMAYTNGLVVDPGTGGVVAVEYI
jgi:hypothetical protein